MPTHHILNHMNVALFIPCYVDQFYPQVGIATLTLLEKLGINVTFPLGQTCCGQPMANAGCEQDSEGALRNFVRNFKGYDYIVAPSGSCVLHIREHLHDATDPIAARQIRERTFDLVEFLEDVLQVPAYEVNFPHRVGLHLSCHGLRGLRLGQSSERIGNPFSKLQSLLGKVKGIELMELDRRDECCGFGGMFAVGEPDISVRMGLDRIADHERHGVEVITAGDMSCLMHLEGLIRRHQSSLKVMHIAEILSWS